MNFCIIPRLKSPKYNDEALELKKDIFSEKYLLEEISCICGRKKGLTVSRNTAKYPLKVRLCYCGGFVTSPYFDNKSLSKFYESNTYRKLYRSINYDQLFNSQYKKTKQLISEEIIFKNKDQKVLFDIGSGAGGQVKAYKDYGYDAYGMEPGIDQREYGKQNGVTIFNDISEFKEKCGKADIITIRHVLEHIPNPENILTEIKAIMKSDSKLFIEVPKHDSWKSSPINFQVAHCFGYTVYMLKLLALKHSFRIDYYNEMPYAKYHYAIRMVLQLSDNKENIRKPTKLHNKPHFLLQLVRIIFFEYLHPTMLIRNIYRLIF